MLFLNLHTVTPPWGWVGSLWVEVDYKSPMGKSITVLSFVSMFSLKQLHIFSSFSPSVHNPSLQPSLFFTTNPSCIRLPKLVFQLDSLPCAQTVGVKGWASHPHTPPMAIPGMHPLSGSGPQPTIWPPSVIEAPRETRQETEHFLCSQKQKTAFCANIGSKCSACLIMHTSFPSSAFIGRNHSILLRLPASHTFDEYKYSFSNI